MIYMKKIRKNSITHNFIFASSQNSESPLSYNAVHLIFSEIDKVFSVNYPECKSLERFDALIKFTPHVTRHTWAYLTIKKLYNLQNKNINGSCNDFVKNSLSMGRMDEAKEALRLLGGWSIKSQMPDLYAKRFLSEQANAANIQRLLQHDSDTTSLCNIGKYFVMLPAYIMKYERLVAVVSKAHRPGQQPPVYDYV